jgi:hypothetical protein
MTMKECLKKYNIEVSFKYAGLQKNERGEMEKTFFGTITRGFKIYSSPYIPNIPESKYEDFLSTNTNPSDALICDFLIQLNKVDWGSFEEFCDEFGLYPLEDLNAMEEAKKFYNDMKREYECLKSLFPDFGDEQWVEFNSYFFSNLI